jgi:hypothetical protein
MLENEMLRKIFQPTKKEGRQEVRKEGRKVGRSDRYTACLKKMYTLFKGTKD